ncbi:class I SAM-dependent methyltransferase [Gordonia amicalis]|uniref:class I SAM-dependent methyltransferase n=1 Tax=Gordonia amicalis TaxID=89053 RepID=UPI0002A6446D|nr:class I SAM-dependent methyltransferase [Gordonia amicalis]MBA5846675.1 methyltransferase domain-containing protein [Gordonia amicalis]MDV7174021.1 methyltransferase domain-containing protein [Gordonia amicalis]NKX76715.1 methyltransferase domain-containing protein [Gordonia amicalis]UKO91636.1 methyltransferase domain-containing protein [Gordonia amicalis]UOG23000.1 methyltransferase domain-containing protein [Gordonia amicalis]
MRADPIDRPADLDAVRASYDRVADDYVRLVVDTGIGDPRYQPWLKAALDAFAESVAGIGPVLDVGCGPGTVTAYLAERGLDVTGVDLSPRMIDNARRLHPSCRFEVGSATDLDLADASLGGVLGWWSLFILPRHVLPQVLASFARALMPGGCFITGTHTGEKDVRRTVAYGGPVEWTTHQWSPEKYVGLIEQAGLRPVAELRLPADEHVGPGLVVMAVRD